MTTPSSRGGLFRSLACLSICVVAIATVANNVVHASDSPAVFCTDVGVDLEFKSSSSNAPPPSNNDKSGTLVAASCLRYPTMNAVGDYLAAKMPALALSAVDCVQESGTGNDHDVVYFAVLSICSRSNIQHQAADERAWDVDVRMQLQKAIGDKKNGIKMATDALWFTRQVVISPPYTLPDGKGMPRFEFRGAKIWVDDADLLNVEVDVRNAGKVPLHLYRVTLIESVAAEDASSSPHVAFALLPSPTVVNAGKTDFVTFTSSTSSPVAIASGKSYVVYISHSGFRSHRFDGVLDGAIFKSTTPVLSSNIEKSDELFSGVVSPASGLDPLLASFPIGSWRVFSVGIVAVVGLAATLYARRRWPRVQLRRVSECLQRSIKQSSAGSSSSNSTSGIAMSKVKDSSNSSANGGGWLKNKKSDGDAANDSMSDRELDELESEGLITLSAPTSSRQGKPRQSVTREKMPAIQMQWKPPVSTSGKFRKPLDLDGDACLDPKRFENMWDEYLQRFQSNEVQGGRVNSTLLLNQMQASGVMCMASGTVGGIEKFVFYAKQRECEWFFFLVVDFTLATKSLGVTIRTSSDASETLVEDFVKMAKATLAESIQRSP